jgi:membrane protease YdiL (CAAX protease family)
MVIEDNPYVTVFFCSFLLIFIEVVLYSLKLKKLFYKFINQNVSAMFFNWHFPSDKPFSLFVIPLLVILVFNFFLVKNQYLVETSVAVFAIAVKVLVEEIVFRGFVFGALLKFFNVSENIVSIKLILPVFLQAIFFVLMHFGTINFFGVFLSGLVFGIVFFFSGKNILPSAMLHLALNLSIFMAGLTENLLGM